MTVVNELPRRFRMWVETLSTGTNDRPLQDILRKNGKVLCLNFTEFVEALYGFPEDNICYIHGCRRKKKYFPKERLILGHMPREETYSYDFLYNNRTRKYSLADRSLVSNKALRNARNYQYDGKDVSQFFKR